MNQSDEFNVEMLPQTPAEAALGVTRVAPQFGLRVAMKGVDGIGHVSNEAEDQLFSLPLGVRSDSEKRAVATTPVQSKEEQPGVWVVLSDSEAGFSVRFKTSAVTVDDEEGSVGLLIPVSVLDIRLSPDRPYVLTVAGRNLEVVYVGGRVKVGSEVVLPFVMPRE